jgi:hypothetical protein
MRGGEGEGKILGKSVLTQSHLCPTPRIRARTRASAVRTHWGLRRPMCTDALSWRSEAQTRTHEQCIRSGMEWLDAP